MGEAPMTADARWLTAVPDDDYFGDIDRVSNTMVRLWMQDRRKYRAYLLGQRDVSTDEMRFGSYFDALVTVSGDVARSMYVVAPDRESVGDTSPESYKLINRNTHRAEWKAFLAGLNGKQWIRPEWHREALPMLEALRAHEDNECKAADLLWAPGENQVVGHWNDAETGTPMRCKLDRLLQGIPADIVDLKTTHSVEPNSLRKSVSQFGYHRQAAIYLDAFEAIEGRPGVMAFVFVERHDDPRVVVQWAVKDTPAVLVGRSQYRKALRQIAKVKTSGDWRAPNEKRSGPLELPGWEMRAHEFDSDVIGKLKGVQRAS